MKVLALVSSFALAATLAGCGAKKSTATDTVEEFLNDPTGDVTVDSASLAENQSDTLDEVASAINEMGSGGTASASFAEMMLAAPTSTTAADTLGSRTCEADTTLGTVTVTMSYDQTKKATAQKQGRASANASKVSSSLTGTGTLKRVWQLPSGSFADAKCTTQTAHFKFPSKGADGSKMVGMSMTETENRTRTMNVSKSGKTLTGRTMKTEGTRSIAFAAASDATATYKKTINTNVTRTITMTKPNGGTVTQIKKMTSPTPMVVNVKRDGTTGELVSKTISAGQMQAENTADAVIVTTTFNNVKYDFASTNDNTCTPTEGTISGETKKNGTVQKSYTIDFGANTTTYPSGISIKLGDAEAVDCPTCVVAKCDMD